MGRKIAILGATSHIAKNLAVQLSQTDELLLYARSIENLREFAAAEKLVSPAVRCLPLGAFGIDGECPEAVINCVGFGTPDKQINAGAELFRVTEKYDNLILDWQLKHPETPHVHLSSGAVYGTGFSRPADEGTRTEIDVNRIVPADYYRLAKLNSEAKHRAYAPLPIVDVRVFSFFSRFIEPESHFLLAEIVRCIRDRSVFRTGPGNIVRDFIHPADLADLVRAAIGPRSHNCVVDAASRAETDKRAILDYFESRYGLRVERSAENAGLNATGENSFYCSHSRSAETLGFQPKYDSMEAIAAGAEALLGKRG